MELVLVLVLMGQSFCFLGVGIWVVFVQSEEELMEEEEK